MSYENFCLGYLSTVVGTVYTSMRPARRAGTIQATSAGTNPGEGGSSHNIPKPLQRTASVSILTRVHVEICFQRVQLLLIADP